MTLAKLEGGYAEQLANKFIWFANGEAGLEEFNVSTVLHRLINKPRRHVIMYDLHDFFFQSAFIRATTLSLGVLRLTCCGKVDASCVIVRFI